MSNNTNTSVSGKIIAAPPPNAGQKNSAGQVPVTQQKLQIPATIALYTDRPDGECPGYTPQEPSTTVPGDGAYVEHEGFLAYSDGTETLTSPITGLRGISFSNNEVSSDYYTRVQRPSESLIGNSSMPSFLPDTPSASPVDPINTSYLFIGTPNTDTINTSQSDNSVTISGQLNADMLTGSSFSDLIFGGYIGSTESDRIFTSTISVDNNSNTIIGGLGDDTIIAGSNSDLIWAGQYNDNTVHGGNNVIYTGGGKDTVYTGSGNNTIHVSNGSHTTITATTEQATINASSGNDSIIISASGLNTIDAGDGNNTISVSGSGSHTISAGGGNDSITLAGTSNNSVSAGTGNNTILVSSSGNNTIHSTGLDTITLSSGITNITTSGTGTVVLNAGDGNHSIVVQNTGITTITAGNGNDTITSSSGSDSISISGGNNQIQSGGGNDVIITGTGHDSITATNGNNTVQTTGGNNTIHIQSGNNSISTGSGIDRIVTGVGNDYIVSTGGNNSITSTGGNNTINVQNGNNILTVGEGNDSLSTGNGNDSVNLAGGNNILLDTGGNNTILAGSGNDILTLSNGNYTITVEGGNNSIALTNTIVSLSTGSTNAGNDTVHITGSISGTLDLGAGQSDVIILENNIRIDANNTHIHNTEALYVTNTSTAIQISQSTMIETVPTSANFYNVSMAGTILSHQILISGSTSTSGNALQIDLTRTDALILGTQEVTGLGTVYIVSISPPGTTGVLMLIPSHFMDNITVTKNGSDPIFLSSLIGTVYDQTNNPYIQVSQGADYESLTTGGSLNQVASGSLQINSLLDTEDSSQYQAQMDTLDNELLSHTTVQEDITDNTPKEEPEQNSSMDTLKTEGTSTQTYNNAEDTPIPQQLSSENIFSSTENIKPESTTLSPDSSIEVKDDKQTILKLPGVITEPHVTSTQEKEHITESEVLEVQPSLQDIPVYSDSSEHFTTSFPTTTELSEDTHHILMTVGTL